MIEGFHGVPYDKPVARTRETIEICRAVWRREQIEHDGLYTIPLPADRGTGLGKPLKMINHPYRADIPIWVAALGDKNVELTAELAQGWLPHIVMPEQLRDVFGPALDAGARSAPPSSVRCRSPAAACWPSRRRCSRRRAAGPGMFALYIGGMGAAGRNFYNTVFARQGYPDEAALVQDLYLDGRKEEAAAALPDDFIDRATLIGPPGFVRERIAALRAAGITHLHVNPVELRHPGAAGPGQGVDLLTHPADDHVGSSGDTS